MTGLALAVLVVVIDGMVRSAAAQDIKVPRASVSPAGSNATPVRVPRALSAELEKDRQSIEIEKATAARMKQQLDVAAQALDAEKSAVAAQEAEVAAMRVAVDATKRKTSTADEFEARRYNRKVVDYNTHANEAIAKREHLNLSIKQYNELVKQHQAQAEIVNQLAAAYNAKLIRYGH